MADRTFHQQSNEDARPRIPLITLTDSGHYKLRPADPDEDTQDIGDKFSAIVIHKCWTRRYFTGTPGSTSELVCGAESETGFMGMKPNFVNPQAPVCGRCPKGTKGDRSCKAGLRLVIARIGKDQSDELTMARFPGKVVSHFMDMETAYDKQETPLVGHRLGFKAEGGAGSGMNFPTTKIVVGKPMTDAEYEAYHRLYEEARTINAPKQDDEEEPQGRTFNQQGEQEQSLQRTTDELGRQRREAKHEAQKSIEDQANENDPTADEDLPW